MGCSGSTTSKTNMSSTNISDEERERLNKMSFYDFVCITSTGEECSMSQFRGKVVYIVNTASQWGRTWTEFQRFTKLHQAWGDEKLQILGFPSLEFGKQEYTTDDKILEFAKSQNFPGILMKLGKVKSTAGNECQEIWNYLRLKTLSNDPNWNFASKYLISKTGQVTISKGNISTEIAELIEH